MDWESIIGADASAVIAVRRVIERDQEAGVNQNRRHFFGRRRRPLAPKPSIYLLFVARSARPLKDADSDHSRPLTRVLAVNQVNALANHVGGAAPP